jgi:hypothetical protein
MVLKGLVTRRKNRCVDTAKVLVVTCRGPFGANSYALYVVERESVQPNACKRLNFEQVEFTPYFSPVSVKNTQHSFLRGSLTSGMHWSQASHVCVAPEDGLYSDKVLYRTILYGIV